MNKQLILALSVGLLAGFITAYVLLTPDLMYLARFADPHTSGEMEGMEGPLIGKFISTYYFGFGHIILGTAKFLKL